METPALHPGSQTPPGPPLARPPPSLTSHARARRPLSSQSLNVGPSLPKGFALVFPPPGTLFPAPFCLASSQSITPQLKCHLPERPPSPPQPPPQLFRPLPHLCCAYSCLFVDLSTPKPHACSSGTGLSRVLLSATSMVPRQCLASRCLINVCLSIYTHIHTCMYSINELLLNAKHHAKCWGCTGRADSVLMLEELTVKGRRTSKEFSRMWRGAWRPVLSAPGLMRAAPSLPAR